MNRREELIREGLNKWKKANHKGILNYATGVGKTWAAIQGTEEFVAEFGKKYKGETVLWVSPTKAIEANTKGEFKKFKKTGLLKHVTFICYASLKKHARKKYPLIVYDEIHHLTSTKRLKISKTIKSKGTLGLSASLSWLQLRKLQPLTVVHKLSINDVSDEGFISPFTIINFGIDLTASERTEYDKLSKKIAWVYQAYQKQSWSAIGTRTRMLYSASNKIKTIRKIVDLFPDEYGIIFTMEKKYSEQIADDIGDKCVFIHSGLSNQERDSRLAQYSDGRTGIRLISTPRIFDEGVTIPRLSYGLLASRCSQERQFIQSLGRLIRKEHGKHAIIIRLYAKNTVEEEWMKNSQKDFKYITVDDYRTLRESISRAKTGRNP